jgi:isoleucyl-tRNA synthetase
MPFLTETVYQKLVRPVDAGAPASIHWCDYPQVDASVIDAALERRMATVRALATLGRRVREDHKIKVRQPLRGITVVHRDPVVRADVQAAAALIADELNVKSVAALADESAFATVAVKPNFKTLGKRCGPKLKQMGPALAAWSFAEVARLEAGESIEVEGEALTLEDVVLQRTAKENAAIATDGEYTVVLDAELDDALRREGVAREAINLFNTVRKDKGFEVSDRVRIAWQCEDAAVAEALREHAPLIAREVLATDFGSLTRGSTTDETALSGATVRFSIDRSA